MKDVVADVCSPTVTRIGTRAGNIGCLDASMSDELAEVNHQSCSIWVWNNLLCTTFLLEEERDPSRLRQWLAIVEAASAISIVAVVGRSQPDVLVKHFSKVLRMVATSIKRVDTIITEAFCSSCRGIDKALSNV